MACRPDEVAGVGKRIPSAANRSMRAGNLALRVVAADVAVTKVVAEDKTMFGGCPAQPPCLAGGEREKEKSRRDGQRGKVFHRVVLRATILARQLNELA